MKKIYILIMIVTISLNAKLNINDFKSNFIQTITTPQKEKKTYTGVITLKNGVFKWEYKKPEKKEVCMSGKMILVVDHRLEQVNIMYIGKKFDMLSILRNAKYYKKDVYTTKIQGVIYTIQMYKNKLKYIIYKDDMDNVITINFKKIKENNIKKPKCNYPASYDVIED